MKFRRIIELLVLVSLLSFAGQAQETPQTISEDVMPRGIGERLIVAERAAGDTSENKILLIAVDQHGTIDTNANVAIDASRYFESKTQPAQDLTKVDPKFLILTNRQGIQSVYSFNAHKISNLSENDLPEELPEQLVNARQINKQALLRTPVEKIVSLGTQFGNATIQKSGLFSWLFKGEREVEKNREAVYLLELLDGAMFDNRYPALLKYFPPVLDGEQRFPNKQLCDIGAVLSLRYHPSAEEAIIFARASNRIDLYCDYAKRLRDDSTRQEERLIQEAEGQHIYVDRISPHFSIVSYDPTKYLANPEWIPHGLQTKSPQNMELTLARWREKLAKQGRDGFGRDLLASDRIPYAIVAQSEGVRYLTILHFFEKNRQRQESLLRNLYHIGTSLGAAMAFPTPLALPINAAEDYFVFKFKQWRQSSFFENSAMAYGRLLAFLQVSDAIDLDWSQTANDTWLFAIDQNMKLSAQEKESLRRAILDRSDKGRRNRAINEIVSRVLVTQGGTRFYHNGGEREPLRLAETRLAHWSRFAKWMENPSHLQKLNDKMNDWAADAAAKKLKTQEKLAARKDQEKVKSEKTVKEPGPATLTMKGRPVILLAVDGLRPDLLTYFANRKMLNNGELIEVIPTLKKYFLDRGTHFKSFTQHTVSVSSFSTILTGVEPDYHGIVVASSDSRDPKVRLEDYLDYIPDNRFLAFAKPESRGLERIHAAQVKWIGDYVPSPLNITVLAPIHDNKFIPYKETGAEGFKQRTRLVYGVSDNSAIIDLGQADHIAKLVSKNPGQYHLIFSYFTSVDHVGHVHSSELDRAIHAVDVGVKRILDAAQKDPVLRNAVLLLVSDHGLSGGIELADPLRKYMPEQHFIDNEIFNLLKMFDGDMPGYPEYRFAIGSVKICESRDVTSGFSYGAPFSLYNTVRSLRPLSPDTCRGERSQKNAGRPGYPRGRTMLLEPQGDGRATALILDNPQAPSLRKSYFELTHYTNPEMRQAYNEAASKGVQWRSQVNIVQDLLHYKSENFQNSLNVRAAINKLNGLHPIDVFSMAIQGSKERAALEELAGINDHATRDPILVQAAAADGRSTLSSLVFVKEGPDFRETRFRYVIVEGFDQKADGTFVGHAITSLRPGMESSDPLHYRILPQFVSSGRGGFVGLDPRVWYTDREILNILIQNEEARQEREARPTAIFAIARILTLNPHLREVAPQYYSDVENMLPDFAVFANEGFHFNPDDLHQADHGGNRRSEVQTTLMLSNLNSEGSGPSEAKMPVFTRDIVPTILDYLGMKDSIKSTQGESLRSYVAP